MEDWILRPVEAKDIILRLGFLMIGVTRADLKATGILPETNELLMICKVIGSGTSMHSSRIKVKGIGLRVSDLEGE